MSIEEIDNKCQRCRFKNGRDKCVALYSDYYEEDVLRDSPYTAESDCDAFFSENNEENMNRPRDERTKALEYLDEL